MPKSFKFWSISNKSYIKRSNFTYFLQTFVNFFTENDPQFWHFATEDPVIFFNKNIILLPHDLSSKDIKCKKVKNLWRSQKKKKKKKRGKSLQKSDLCSKRVNSNCLGLPRMITLRNHRWVLHLLPQKAPKLACFVLYLKIINIFLKNNICIL